MDYCGPQGLPHSQFLAWDDADQQKALWWTARERQRCGSCGTHPDDWNPAAGGHPDAMRAEERVCPGCARRSIADDELEKARKTGLPKHGVHIVLVSTTEGGE